MQAWFCRVGLLWLALFSLPAMAEEPYERFLQRLKDEQLYDLALAYLNQLEDKRGLSPRFKADLELERGLLQYQSAAILPSSNSQRTELLDEAEKSLRRFLDERRNHPRRGEARLKIGELLLQRADEAKSESDDSATKNEEAVRFYDEAHQLFEATIQELAGILERIKGARTDPNDKAAVAYRQKIQQDLRQAQLLSAKSVEERGRAREADSPQRTADLRQALKMFADLYSKEQRMVGVRNYALFYRSSIQNTLGQTGDAIDGFQRVIDLEGVDVLRPLQSAALTELVGLLASQQKFPVAVERAEKWIANLRPDERDTEETLKLQLELAKARLAWSEKLREKDPDDRVASRLVRDTRSELRSLLRVTGKHQEETRELLSKLGVETNTTSDSELPNVSSFAEAITEAQERIDQSENDALGVAVLREQGQTSKAEQAEQQINTARLQALELLRKGLQLFSAEDELSELERARFSIAYLELKLQNPWEALAVAEFITRKNPRTDQGLRAAAIALGAFSDLLRTAGKDEKLQLTAHLEPFAGFLVKTWPDSAESAAAASALVQLALMNKQWDKLEQYLALAPSTGESALNLRRDVGLTFFARYLDEKKQAGEETDATRALKRRALQALRLVTADLKVDELDEDRIEAINALGRLLLIDQQLDEAEKLLLTSKTAPVKVIQQQQDLVGTKVAMNSYRTTIQLVISLLAAGRIQPDQAIQQTVGYIGQLQSLADKAPSGASTLASILVALARDLQAQLALTKQPDKRRRLSEAMIVLAKEAAKSEQFSTQYWAADTILATADELNSDRSSRQLALQAYADASQILERILAQEKTQPGFIQPEGFSTQIRLLLAKASRGLGDYKGAMNELAEILRQNNGLLDVQMEAARVYQAWGDAVNAGFHKAAYLGGRPDPQTRDNLIWGWGKIARVVERLDDYERQFYEARYQLARSRYKYAASLQGQAQQDAYRRAEKDITSTATLYAELGGPAMRKKYDTLLKAVQKALGKEANGLSALKQLPQAQ